MTKAELAERMAYEYERGMGVEVGEVREHRNGDFTIEILDSNNQRPEEFEDVMYDGIDYLMGITDVFVVAVFDILTQETVEVKVEF